MPAHYSPVRLGVVGLGNIGQQHIALLNSAAVPDLQLAAVCARTQPEFDYGVPFFAEYEAMLASGLIDAVLIASPTRDHPDMGRAALQRGLHILMEKPLAMSIGQAAALLASADEQVVGVMLNQRYHPAYRRIHELLGTGELGDVVRYSWVMTAWYRPDVYYKVSEWRGTWPGEGGGLLINQCIHNLDVLQWWLGLPDKIVAQVGLGKYHDIDVEDEVSAIFTHASGVTGTLVASSGEAPGLNQLDIVCDRGMLRFDGETLTLLQGNQSTQTHLKNTNDMFGVPEFSTTVLNLDPTDSQHAHLLNDFAHAILTGQPLQIPAEEGLGSLQLANAMLLSGWRGEAVTLPINYEDYEEVLQQRISSSSMRVAQDIKVNIDMEKSYR